MSSSGSWYHTTDADLSEGDEIVPASDRGYDSMWKDVPGYSQHHVYIFSEDADALSYDTYGQHNYEIEPVGGVQRDPEFEYNKNRYPEESEMDVPGYHSYVTPLARVVKKIW